MNRNQLAAAIADETGTTQSDARAFLDAFTRVVQKTTAVEGVVSLPAFGTFKAVDVPARTRTNPQTGQPMVTQATRRVKFTVGSHFKETVAGQRAVPASS